jgi:hypothetical protein
LEPRAYHPTVWPDRPHRFKLISPSTDAKSI